MANSEANVLTAKQERVRSVWLGLAQRLLRMAGSIRFERKVPSLRVCQTVSLGERRLLAVVEWEGERLLVGATQQSITVLKGRAGATKEAEPCR